MKGQLEIVTYQVSPEEARMIETALTTRSLYLVSSAPDKNDPDQTIMRAQAYKLLRNRLYLQKSIQLGTPA